MEKDRKSGPLKEKRRKFGDGTDVDDSMVEEEEYNYRGVPPSSNNSDNIDFPMTQSKATSAKDRPAQVYHASGGQQPWPSNNASRSISQGVAGGQQLQHHFNVDSKSQVLTPTFEPSPLSSCSPYSTPSASQETSLFSRSPPMKKRPMSSASARDNHHRETYPFFGVHLPNTTKLVALKILDHLDGKSIYAMSVVSVLWNAVALDDALWE